MPNAHLRQAEASARKLRVLIEPKNLRRKLRLVEFGVYRTVRSEGALEKNYGSDFVGNGTAWLDF